MVFTRLVTSLGTTVFAAHSIALTAEEAFYIPGYGMQSAATTLTGNAVGARDEKKLRHTSSLLLLLSFSFMTITGSLLFLLATQMMQLFTPDAEVIRLGASALRIVALSEPIFGISIILEGIFNGAGDTKHPFLYSLFSMWGIRIVGTFLCVHFFHLGLNAVWLCMVADNVCRGILLTVRYRRLRSDPDLLNKMKSTPARSAFHFIKQNKLMPKCPHHDQSSPYGRILPVLDLHAHRYVHRNSPSAPEADWLASCRSDIRQNS